MRKKQWIPLVVTVVLLSVAVGICLVWKAPKTLPPEETVTGATATGEPVEIPPIPDRSRTDEANIGTVGLDVSRIQRNPTPLVQDWVAEYGTQEEAP